MCMLACMYIHTCVDIHIFYVHRCAYVYTPVEYKYIYIYVLIYMIYTHTHMHILCNGDIWGFYGGCSRAQG